MLLVRLTSACCAVAAVGVFGSAVDGAVDVVVAEVERLIGGDEFTAAPADQRPSLVLGDECLAE